MHEPRFYTIQAAVLRRKGRPLDIQSLVMEAPREDEILVRLVASGICRTDIDLWEHGCGGGAPVVLGHEGAGVVERVGRRVKRVKAGDHVVLSYQSCGRCRPCRAGHPFGCARFFEVNFGFQRPDGSNALEQSGVRGHFFGQSSFSTHAIDNRRGDLTARIARITGGGVDYALEITGIPRMHQLAIDVLKPYGRAALFSGETGTDALPQGRQTVGIIQGDAVPQQFIPQLIDLYRAGRFPFDRLLRFYDFADINRAMADARNGVTVKPVLRIGAPPKVCGEVKP